MISLNEYIDSHTYYWPLVYITNDQVEKLSRGEDIIINGIKICVTEDPTLISTTVDIDECLTEARIRVNNRMKNSNKVVSNVTKELFGPDGKYEQQIKKIFLLFKKAIKDKAIELGIPMAQIRTWKITLRDHNNPKEGEKI